MTRTPLTSLCALDDALENLTRIDPRRAKVIELRFFGGLSVEETAEALQVSPQTVMRDWRLARAWLARELRGAVPQNPPDHYAPERARANRERGQILFLARLSSFADSRGAGNSTLERANASHCGCPQAKTPLQETRSDPLANPTARPAAAQSEVERT